MRIGVDMDDVMIPWFDPAHEACERAGITNGRPATQWAPYLDYGCPQEAWLEVMREATLDGSLYTGPTYPGVVEAMGLLADAGHTLHIVTARGFLGEPQLGALVKAMTVEWLFDHAIPHDSLTFSKDKTLVRTDVFADDSVHHVQELDRVGTHTWLVNATHNRAAFHARRVDSLWEFANRVVAVPYVPA